MFNLAEFENMRDAGVVIPIVSDDAPALESTPSSTPSPNSGAEVEIFQAHDGAALREAVSRVCIVEGVVKQAKSLAGDTFMVVTFERVANEGFEVIVNKAHRPTIEADLGRELSVVLPGSHIRVRGQIMWYKNRPQMFLTRPEQLTILSMGKEKNDSATISGESNDEILDVLNHQAMRDAINSEVVVSGRVFSVTRGGKNNTVMFIHFEDGQQGFYLALFKDRLDSVAAAFGGDLMAALTGKQIRARGNVKLYRGRINMIINSADQLTVLD